MDAGRRKIGDGALHVSDEVPQKERAVAALEADLVVVDDDSRTKPQ
jgi:hypothetical protein